MRGVRRQAQTGQVSWSVWYSWSQVAQNFFVVVFTTRS